VFVFLEGHAVAAITAATAADAAGTAAAAAAATATADGCTATAQCHCTHIFITLLASVHSYCYTAVKRHYCLFTHCTLHAYITAQP
jgi:hypothetical protein